MKDVWTGQVGIWGQRHYQYLKENKPTTLNIMRMNGTLKSHLQSIDEQAEEMTFQLVKQIAKQEGVTEELKRRDQMAWVGAMNNIRDRVNEIVLNEVIFV
ncbi:MAG: TnpV protein [Clostridiales bacterium]|nr:TnpV protein [Clostridiales bacterium]